jgi:hypothetical protein
METIRQQTYKNIVTIVHSDDPRDEYVEGDIIIRGTAYGIGYGNGPYNLYNNRLLKAIPDTDGWYHFIDDDDEYCAPDSIEKLVAASKKNHMNVARVIRWNGVVFPKEWGKQKSYQTECFFLDTGQKNKAKWWANLGGDHYYSKQMTRILPVNWIDDLIIARAQEGKGHGRKFDRGGKLINLSSAMKPTDRVTVLGLVPSPYVRQNAMARLTYDIAYRLEQEGKVKITNWTTYNEPKPIRHVMAI